MNLLFNRNLKCQLLEEGLFGCSGALSTLPASWLPVEMLNRQTKIDEDTWKFSQEMLSIIRKHEEKKKVVFIIVCVFFILNAIHDILSII